MKQTIRSVAMLGMALAFLAAVVSTVKLAPAQQPPTPAPSRKVFTDSVTPLPGQPGLTPHGLLVHAATPEHKTDRMEILFSLSIPKEAQANLEERVARGEIIPRKELEQNYAPKAADFEALVKWLKKEGFEIAHTTPDRTSVYAKGTVAQIEKSLQVQMVRVTKGGITYNAARNAPSLPADVGASVHAILGLQPFRHARKHSRKVHPNIANNPPYLVSEILKAYHADQLPVTGAGQKIAILIDTFPVDSDLQQFWQKNQLPVQLTNVEKVNVSGGSLPGQEGEETLDVEWTTGIAPGAKVRVYATGSLAFVDLDRALDQIYTDAVSTEPTIRQLSISLGLGETFMGGPQGEVATQHQKFLKLAAAGVNIFVSSGDGGSNPDETGQGSTGPTQAEYESSDPMVVGVGGTSLTLHPQTGTVTSEKGWGGSGGGKSIFFARPQWQKGKGVPSGNERLVPDVSLAADPNRGAFVFFQGQAQQIGGTSWSAPTWAGFCALLNEARAKANKPPLPLLTTVVYPLMETACFRDITEGSNGQFTAGSGYDMVTGIGVPNVKALIDAVTTQDQR
ncbi:MAG TPA: S53 family peptidase [Gemmataceae bacterium]|nr:S53 family peptidase [Gemmataceae bacterium]